MKRSIFLLVSYIGVSIAIETLLFCGCSNPSTNIPSTNSSHGNSTVIITSDTTIGGEVTVYVTISDSTPGTTIVSADLWEHDTTHGGTDNLIAVNTPQVQTDQFITSFTFVKASFLWPGPNKVWVTAHFSGLFTPDVLSSSITVYY